MNRREFLNRLGAGALGFAGFSCLGPDRQGPAPFSKAPPNIVVIFADDLGYGDLGCLGHPTIRTPGLDRMADEGTKLTQFYSAAPVCTPSRAALLTGRLPIRSGMCSDKRRVLFPDSAGGLPQSEITAAEALRSAGYATACVGKWHLGHLPPHLPTRHGFDTYFGIPYSNDMKPCPLMENETVIEEPAVQETLTRRYTERAVAFIRRNRQKPFFLYFAHTFPHVPLFASADFMGESLRGLYGDVVEELDHSVGRILQTLRSEGLAENTLVIFTSDNGPWLTCKLNGGSAGLLRGGKGSTWEGGMREPCLAWWPGTIPSRTVASSPCCTMDIFATSLALAGADPPKDRIVDGRDITSTLLGRGADRERVIYFYRGTHLMALRMGPWKAHFITQGGYGNDRKKHDPPALYHLEHDPSEKHNKAKKNPDVIARILEERKRHESNLVPAASQLEIKI